MSLVLQELQHPDGPPSPAAIDAFFAERQIPVVEGTSATFFYRGEADEVVLQHWIYGLTASQSFSRLPGTDVWHLTIDLPPRSRVEYKLGVIRGTQQQLIRDPLNPNTARDPYGANSVVHGEGYQAPDWIAPHPDARPGTVESRRMLSEALGGVRELQIYLPARFRESRRYPLLIVHDGPDYLRFAELQAVLDNLIHRLEIPPLIAALTGSPRRLVEYANDPQHAAFVADELLPLMEEHYPLIAHPSARALMGSSFGAVATLSAAWHRPGVFGNLLLQSGSFAFTDIGEHDRGPVFDPVVSFVNDFRAAPGKPAERVYMSCGTYESLIYYNRSMLPLLQSTGMAVRYTEARDGHNWENWRDRLREGLSWLFPGPLWMVYE